MILPNYPCKVGTKIDMTSVSQLPEINIYVIVPYISITSTFNPY